MDRAAIRSGLAATLVLALAPLASLADCKLQKIAEFQTSISNSRALVDGTLNGVPARFFLDSGSFVSGLSRQSIAPYQLKLERLAPGYRVSGVGGSTTPMLATVKNFTLKGLGGNVFHDVVFLVLDVPADPEAVGFIGQNLLSAYDTEYDLANGVVRLFKPKDCKKQVLAYWHGDVLFGEMPIESITDESMHLIGRAKLNGRSIDVLLDTGAPRSMLTERIAGKVGVTRQSKGVIPGGVTSGIGRRFVDSWIARFDELDLGGELVRNTRLRVADVDLPGDIDMMLGADFFLSHRVYVANSQDRIYFTFNGGHVFDLGVTLPEDGSAADGTKTPAAAVSDSMDAAALKRRGAAHAERGNFRDALTDFDQSLQLDANDAETHYQRGMALWKLGERERALADFDEALRLKPEDTVALTARGALRLQFEDKVGASADFETAQRVSPKDAGLQFRIAHAYVETDHFEDALPLLDRWIAANRKSESVTMALNSRCWARAMLNRELDLALADCNAALKAASENALMLDSRALVWLRRGEYGKAIADYRKVIASQPGKSSSLYGLGIAELRSGQKEQGQKDIDAATAVAPYEVKRYQRFGLTP